MKTGDSRKYLTFMLMNRLYAVSIDSVKEILEYETVNSLPKMPPVVAGSINLRGKILPVIDLVRCFEGHSSIIGNRSCIVIVSFSQNMSLSYEDKNEDFTKGHLTKGQIGIIVDTVNQVITLSQKDIDPAPNLGKYVNTDFIAGIAKNETCSFVILDIENILLLDEFQS